MYWSFLPFAIQFPQRWLLVEPVVALHQIRNAYSHLADFLSSSTGVVAGNADEVFNGLPLPRILLRAEQ